MPKTSLKAAKKPAPAGRKKKDNDEELGFGKSGHLMKPPDQERLTDPQMREEISRTLTSEDPLKPRSSVVWNFKNREFSQVTDDDPMVTLLHLESELFFKDSTEAAEYEGKLIEEIDDPEESSEVCYRLPREAKVRITVGALDLTPDEEAATSDTTKPKGKKKKLLNQFNFCNRAAQTINNPQRDHPSQTAPPPKASYKEWCNPWIISDAYKASYEVGKKASMTECHEQRATASMTNVTLFEKETDGLISQHPSDQTIADEEALGEEEGQSKQQGSILERQKVKMRKASILEGQAAQDQALSKSVHGLKILERLIMENVHGEILFDFKYYEDASDEFRETGDGTLLPLWKFSFEKAKRLHVTGISWSKSEPDMFAVSYGSYSFIHPIVDGVVVVYSLRNPAYPEQVWTAPKGAMSVDVHPKNNGLVAVGLYDGNVAMMSLKQNACNKDAMVLKNMHTETKHRAPVWTVKWGEDDMEGNPNFFSAGMDGKIFYWSVNAAGENHIGGLYGTEVATLNLPLPPVHGPDGTTFNLFGCARCLAFHPKDSTLFLVGTAEGNIFRCSAQHGSRFQQIYSAHFLPVAALEWNSFHSDVFISCSEDWTIKIWDRNDENPMYVFELGIAVLDCCWAPYSSTTFAACTDEGKVLIYDLNVNKEKPLCCQQVVTKKKVRPHRIQFNPFYPIIIIGDDRGQLTSLKLSPNLRILPRDTRNMLLEGDARINCEVNKMTKLLTLVRDPESMRKPTPGKNKIPQQEIKDLYAKIRDKTA